MPQPPPPKEPRVVPALRKAAAATPRELASGAAKPQTEPPDRDAPAAGLPAYAELHCRSNFSFLIGASHPQELVTRAAELGYTALALTDECSVAGVVRAHEAMRRVREQGYDTFKLLLGASFTLSDEDATPIERTAGKAHETDPTGSNACHLVLIARNRQGWGDLCEWITQARLRCPKGGYRLDRRDFDAHTRWSDAVALLVPTGIVTQDHLTKQARWLAARFEHAAIAMELLLQGNHEAAHVQAVQDAARTTGLPIVAAGDVLMHKRSRKPVQDTLTAIRLKTPLAECGRKLAPNAEQHLRSRLRLASLYRREWLDETVRLASLCDFSLDELRYEYPREIVPEGLTPIEHLRAITLHGAHHERYPGGAPASVLTQLEREFELIEALAYEAFFLTVHDIVRHARSLGILCRQFGRVLLPGHHRGRSDTDHAAVRALHLA
jgi:error-prone DNA polymerase